MQFQVECHLKVIMSMFTNKPDTHQACIAAASPISKCLSHIAFGLILFIRARSGMITIVVLLALRSFEPGDKLLHQLRLP